MTQPVTLHYVDQGAGVPVVLLHGFPLDHSIWQAQIDDLSRSYRVIAPDLRGHGHSPVVAGTASMELLARDVIALLDHLEIAQAVWVGHSMGGYLTLAALRIAPERIRGVGLVATHPYADSREKCMQRLQDASRVLEEGVGGVADNMLAVLFAPDVDPQSEMAQRIYRLMLETSPEGVASALRGMAERHDETETLRALRVPATVVVGESDRLVKVETAQAVAEMIPGARCVILEKAGHMPMLEQPGATTAALRDLMALAGG